VFAIDVNSFSKSPTLSRVEGSNVETAALGVRYFSSGESSSINLFMTGFCESVPGGAENVSIVHFNYQVNFLNVFARATCHPRFATSKMAKRVMKEFQTIKTETMKEEPWLVDVSLINEDVLHWKFLIEGPVSDCIVFLVQFLPVGKNPL
jgi:hypothetical protein